MSNRIRRYAASWRAVTGGVLALAVAACGESSSSSVPDSVNRWEGPRQSAPPVPEVEATGLYVIVFLFFAAVVGTIVWLYFAKKRGDTSIASKLGVLGGLTAGAAFGVVASQYFPVLGSIEKLGKPWSPARMSLIGIHVIVLGLAGAACGVLIAWLRGRPKPSAAVTATPATAARPAARLAELKSLHEQGLLSAAEYETKRAEVVSTL